MVPGASAFCFLLHSNNRFLSVARSLLRSMDEAGQVAHFHARYRIRSTLLPDLWIGQNGHESRGMVRFFLAEESALEIETSDYWTKIHVG